MINGWAVARSSKNAEPESANQISKSS